MCLHLETKSAKKSYGIINLVYVRTGFPINFSYVLNR